MSIDAAAKQTSQLLEQLAVWRERLTETSAQRALERILFLRMADERLGHRSGHPNGLSALAAASQVYPALCAHFRGAERRFGSFFHLDDEASPPPFVDDRWLREILHTLGDHQGSYDFSLFPVGLLGQVHEHSLGQPTRAPGRKSGGVYYTPDHVVRYIAHSTLGVALSGLTPDQVTSLRVLDPACGSGSFLLGAFQLLIDWHRDWYTHHHPEAHARGDLPALFQDERGTWQLTSAKRREIAKNNIFGVDLDPEAIAITKLSLLLQSLDERTSPSPLDLERNIQRGDSLIATQFDYPQAFPAIFADGGFDVVLGNPPYLSYGGRQLVGISRAQRAYLAEHYECAGWATAHSFFMERSAKVLTRRFVSFIVPDQVGHLDGYRSVRSLLLREGGLVEVKYWGESIFKGVVTPALTFILDKNVRPQATRIVNVDETEQSASFEHGAPWTLSRSADLLGKLRHQSMSIRPLLADCGLRTTDAKKQVVKLTEAKGDVLPTLEGKQIGRYWCAPPVVGVRLDSGRPVFRARDEKYARARFVIRQTAAYPIVGPREHVTHFRNSLHALYEPAGELDVRFVVALLNSKVMRFAYVTTVREAQQRAFPQVKLGPLGTLPIRTVDLREPADKARHDRLAHLVESMLVTQRELRHPQTGRERAASLRSEAAGLDMQIDRLVFDLYELTESEIARVEQTVAGLAAAP